jgi:glycosyltransferase involved in cell wall biosynthesis
MARILMAAYTNYRRDPRVRREAEALAQAGHQVVVLARREVGEAVRERIRGVEVVKVRGWKNTRTSAAMYALDYSAFFFMLFLHLVRYPLRYRLVHINNMPDFLVFATCLQRLMGRPVIHDVHDLMPELFAEKFDTGEKSLIVRVLKMQERWAGRFASVVLTVEDGLKDILSARGVRREKIHVLMNLPDEKIFSPRPTPPAKPPDAPLVIVYHGTLARRLGLDVALEAVAKATQTIPSLQLRIIGAGEERTALMELRDRLHLSATVTFSDGFVPVERIPEMITDADIGVVPLRMSRGTAIMLPTKLLEYVRLGIPCIVPSTPTIQRYFDQRMVQFFEAENADSLAEAIITLYRDPQRRSRLADQAIERFGNVHTWSEHKKAYVELVRRLLEGRRGAEALSEIGKGAHAFTVRPGMTGRNVE